MSGITTKKSGEPEILLIKRDAWTDADGRSYRRDVLEIRGGDIRRDWAAFLKPPAASWCQVTIWSNETRISVCGGSVWPTAWPQLFQVVGHQRRQSTLMTPMAVERFAAAREAGS